MNPTESIVPIIALIIIGYVLREIGILKPEDALTLNKIVINIAIPSLIFLSMYSADLSYIYLLAPIPLVCILIGFFCGLLAYTFSRIKGYSKKTRWSIVSTSTLMNSGFLGYPIVLGVFGGAGLIRAVFYDIGSMLLFITLGILLILIFGGSYSSILKRALTFPPLWAIILGLLSNLSNLDIGSMAENILRYLSGATIPLIMLSLGLSLEIKGIRKYLGAASYVSITRLVVSPLTAFIIVYFLGMAGLERMVTILEAAMPSGMISLVLAITYRLDIDATTACIFLSTLLSMISISILVLVL